MNTNFKNLTQVFSEHIYSFRQFLQGMPCKNYATQASSRWKIKILSILFLLTFVVNAFAENPPILNAFKSAILPGWGQLSLGNNSGYVFIAAEVALWSTMFYFESEADLKLKQADLFAITHGNLRSYELNDEIYYLMERYNSSGFVPGGYNESVVNTAMERFPNDPERQTKYINDNILDESIYWDWGNTATRGQFRGMRNDSLYFTDYSKIVGGTILANHVISFIHTLILGNRQANSFQNNVTFYSGFDKEFTPYLNCVVRF